jgi:hypothetical protein
MLREVRLNPPVAHSIRVGHRVAGDSLAAKAQMIKFGGLRFETGFDVSQTSTPRQLCKRKTAKLVETGEVLDLMITTVARDTTPERMPRQMIHDLRENVLAGVHRRPRDQNKPQRSENARKNSAVPQNLWADR